MAHDYINKVVNIVKKHNFQNKNIIFEITERDTVKNLMYLENLIYELIKKEFSFALDDFGSGFSSFIYLKKFQISYIKIDGYFINRITDDEDNIDLIFVKSIIYLAKELNIKIVAEFVEDEKVYNLLKKLNVDYLQGYYIDKPSDKLIELKDLNEKK